MNRNSKNYVRRQTSSKRTGAPILSGAKFIQNLPRPLARLTTNISRPLMTRSVMPTFTKPSLGFARRPSVLYGPKTTALRKPQGTAKSRPTNVSLYSPRALLELRMRYPRKVLFCVGRKIRRSVLFAFNKAGYKGSGPGRGYMYRRSGNSQYSC